MISECPADITGIHEGSTRSREVVVGSGAMRDVVEA
jgi:hypothetical protein